MRDCHHTNAYSVDKCVYWLLFRVTMSAYSWYSYMSVSELLVQSGGSVGAREVYRPRGRVKGYIRLCSTYPRI